MYPKTESQDATARFSTPEAGQREEAHHFFEVNGSPSSSKKRVQLELDSDDEVELRASPSKKQHKAKEEDDGDWTPGRGDEPRQRPAGEQAYMKRNVPPSGVQGRRVIWDRQIKVSRPRDGSVLAEADLCSAADDQHDQGEEAVQGQRCVFAFT